MRKLDFCLGENKDANQLHSNCEADQRLCIHYTDQATSLQLGLCRKSRRPVFSRRRSITNSEKISSEM